MHSNERETRCVLLASDANGTRVRDQLDARGWVAHLSNDPLPALAELCLLDRLDAKRRAWGRPSNSLALVVVNPSQWSQLPAMLSAARRYVPTAALWTFEDGRLTPLVVPDDSDNGSAASRQADPTNEAVPRSYEMSTTPEAPTAGHDNDRDSRQITGDEISMLLDGDYRSGQGTEPKEDVESTDKPDPDPEA
jgi:hypothetical protein